MKQAEYDALLKEHEPFVRKMEEEMDDLLAKDSVMSDGYLREHLQSKEFVASLHGKDKLKALFANQMQ